MKRHYLAALGVIALFGVGKASTAQSLLGQPIQVDYVYPNQATDFQTLGTGTVTNGGITFNSFGQTNYLVTPSQIEITNVEGSAVQFTPAAFNGISVTETGGTPTTITGVTIAPSTNLVGFNASDVSFDANQVFVNLESLTTEPSTTVLLDLQFSGASSTPEPGAYALFASAGLSGAAFLRRKRVR